MKRLLTVSCLLTWAMAWGGTPEVLEGKVLASANGDGYTYLQVDVGEENIWAFGPQAEIRLHQKISIPTDDRRRRHKSKELDQVFRHIYYVATLNQAVSGDEGGEPVSAEGDADAGMEKPGPVRQPAAPPAVAGQAPAGAQLPAGHPKVPGRPASAAGMPAGHPTVPGMKPGAGKVPGGHPKAPGAGGMGMGMGMPPGRLPAATTPAKPIEVAKADGGHRIEEIFARKAELAGQVVLVRGQIVKLNREIMQRNWIHIQDGTGGKGTNDLTVTTDQNVTDVGAVVLVRGKLAVDRDFGFGYKYDVILEEAEVKVEE